jgi:predicted ATP-dependent endonuclease of OLD family
LRRSDRGFKIFNKDGSEVSEDQVSSGEAELIALAIEVLVFSRDSRSNRVLLLDEPDVHLHPDLQQRFVTGGFGS